MSRLLEKLNQSNLSSRFFCFACILIMLPEAGYALDWQDLWKTPDQQGQQAFQQEQYEQAAGRFDNPEWKAASQYKAGQYEQVLDTLKDVQTSEGFYNKGNAHARQGQLKEALEAYEKSLEINPDHADAQYNKELIEKELEKQKQQQDQGDSGDQQQNEKQDQDQGQEQQNKGNSQKQQEGSGDQSDSDQEQKQDQQKPASQDENPQDESQKGSEAEPKPSEDRPAQNEKSKEQDKPTETSDEQVEKEEDAEASAAEPSTERKDESEQASEQWLKRIPDDPAGLLKRKFEYQYKQRNVTRGQQENW